VKRIFTKLPFLSFPLALLFLHFYPQRLTARIVHADGVEAIENMAKPWAAFYLCSGNYFQNLSKIVHWK